MEEFTIKPKLLQKCQYFNDLLKDSQFDLECRLFLRLMYKARNPHKRTKYYRHLEEVARFIKRIREFEFEITKKNTKNEFETTIHELQQFHKLFKVEELMMKAYVSCKSIASKSYFMSVTMTFMAVLSRLFVIVKRIETVVLDCYDSYVFEYCSLFKESKMFDCLIPHMFESAVLTIPTSNDLENISFEKPILPSVEIVGPPMAVENTNEENSNSVKSTKNKKKKSKKSKKTDDIDDIFGFI